MLSIPVHGRTLQSLSASDATNEVIRGVDWSNLDGRDRLGLVVWDEPQAPGRLTPTIPRGGSPCFAGVFSRMISIGSGAVVYSINLEACAPGTGLDELTAEAIALWIREICVADMERGVRRSKEAGGLPQTVVVRCQNRSGSISGEIVARVLREDLLEGREQLFAAEFQLGNVDFTISTRTH